MIVLEIYEFENFSLNGFPHKFVSHFYAGRRHLICLSGLISAWGWMLDFAPAKNCFCARKKLLLRTQKVAFAPAKNLPICARKNLLSSRKKICDHKIFAFRRKSFCTRKYLIHFCAQNGLRSLLQKSGNCAQKKFLHANYAFCAQAKIPENGNPNRGTMFALCLWLPLL